MMRWTTTRARARSRVTLPKKLSQCDGAVGNERIVLNVRWTDELGRGFLRFLLVDHLFIKGKNIVFVANGAFIGGVYDLDHGQLLFCFFVKMWSCYCRWLF